ncbi:copper chaperone PCu(A)C [Xanthomonas nasturtii]|uniref:Copper chaperone PCu(A)C n=1 Tax=Xanthomonas nasturtii TaxID=1843581 RepID=A0A3E1KF39_9XANT|nr:copper chaperone PCu(A)C [Xanthomonas nasturtii]MCL1528569.1 copper chaperone PCu(A)C [Xanthomonas nasturtii]MCL1532205.1 copper chaperone PCu(A)C [Xanthomonas nasturtii]MCL1536187.1 copper chaperone PCu(A)C [Xanthomonas nasturtii]MCL1545526.1 copper chaperone PCu(A)C [Xanthomonas nasturtii]MCL1553710.1 copper chaperone PCu(A)C [Xanthomonas nasturtii]
MKLHMLMMATLSALTLVACERAPAPESSPAPAAVTPTATAAPAAAAAVVASDAWSRATPPGAPVAGGYLTLRNQSATPDRLVAVESPASAHVEIHEMRMEAGVMKMRHLEQGLVLPPGEPVVLGPGGMHLMFIAPHAPFEEGKPVVATLVFEHAPRVEVHFAVRPMGVSAPDADSHAQHMH